jgi:hypothetical protein
MHRAPLIQVSSGNTSFGNGSNRAGSSQAASNKSWSVKPGLCKNRGPLPRTMVQLYSSFVL